MELQDHVTFTKVVVLLTRHLLIVMENNREIANRIQYFHIVTSGYKCAAFTSSFDC
jgi:hypothetical protein